MRILYTREFPGDLRMFDTIVENAPDDFEFIGLPSLSELASSPDLRAIYADGADALLSCILWHPQRLRTLFGDLPLGFLPHNACPVKSHYWFPEVLDTADFVLATGPSMGRKALLERPGTRVVDVPYPRLEAYRPFVESSTRDRYDLVFACTAYSHYPLLMNLDSSIAYWHELVCEASRAGFRVAVLRHGNDEDLVEIDGVDYFDQPNPQVLFSGRAVVTDLASNGLIAAALGHPVFQVVDADGRVEPRLVGKRGPLEERFAIGPQYGRDWNIQSIRELYPFTAGADELHQAFQSKIDDHIHRSMQADDFYAALRSILTSHPSTPRPL